MKKASFPLTSLGLSQFSRTKHHFPTLRKSLRFIIVILGVAGLTLLSLPPAWAAGGALDPNFNPGLGVSNIPILCSPNYYNDSSGKMIIAGDFTAVDGTNRTAIARLFSDGSLDSSFNTEVNGQVSNSILLNPLSPNSQILIAGEFTIPSTGGAYYGLALLNSNGSVDTCFAHTFGSEVGVQAIGLQSDGRIVVGGYAMSVNSYAGTYYLLRLDANGTVDTSYTMRSGAGAYIRGLQTYPTDPTYPNSVRLFGTIPRWSDPTHMDHMLYLGSDGTTVLGSLGEENVNGPILTMVFQSDNKPIIVGSFDTVYGESRNGVARLLATGGLDTDFKIGTGANGFVQRVNLDSGKVVLAGNFTSFNGTGFGYLVRLFSDGTVDTTFNIGTGADDRIWIMFKRGDGTWMIFGAFQFVNGSSRQCMANLAADGTLNPQYATVTMANTNPAAVYAIQDSPQGLYIAGDFTGYGGKLHRRLARVNFDGTPDASFTAGFDRVVKSISYNWQGDGKILVAGDFGMGMGYIPLTGVARLNSDGTLDRTFKSIITKPDGSMPELSLLQSGWDPNGHILVGGAFATVNGVARSSLARLNADGTLDDTLNFNPATSMPGLTNIKINGAGDDTGGPFVVAGKATYNSATSGFYTRLLNDGSLDPSFANGPSPVPHVVIFNGKVKCGTGDETGQNTLGGEFTQILDGATNPQRNYLARFTPDGLLDSTFAPAGPNGPVYALETQYTAQYTTNKILLGGAFTSYNGVPRNNLARINRDGSLDTGFNPGAGANGAVLAIAYNDYIHKARIGGAFTTYNGVSRPGLAQILAGGSYNPAINFLLLLE